MTPKNEQRQEELKEEKLKTGFWINENQHFE